MTLTMVSLPNSFNIQFFSINFVHIRYVSIQENMFEMC